MAHTLSVVWVSLFVNMLLRMRTIVLHRCYHIWYACSFATLVLPLMMSYNDNFSFVNAGWPHAHVLLWHE